MRLNTSLGKARTLLVDNMQTKDTDKPARVGLVTVLSTLITRKARLAKGMTRTIPIKKKATKGKNKKETRREGKGGKKGDKKKKKKTRVKTKTVVIKPGLHERPEKGKIAES